MIGSHNTYSYLPCIKWWMKFLSPWHKCQSREALFTNNCNYFDIRVTWCKNHWCFCHNNIVYKTIDVLAAIKTRLLMARRSGLSIYIRLILDIRKKPKNSEEIISKFNGLIESLKNYYIIKACPEILDEIRIFWNWEHPIKKSTFNIIEDHVSVKGKWWEYLLGTKYYAKKHNKLYQSKEYVEDKNNVYLIDYISLYNEE